MNVYASLIDLEVKYRGGVFDCCTFPEPAWVGKQVLGQSLQVCGYIAISYIILTTQLQPLTLSAL